MPSEIDAEAAIAHLVAADPVLGRVIAEAGPFEMRDGGSNAFHALSRSIIFQQLSGKAAGTIFGRVVALFDRPGQMADGFPAPAALLAATDEQLRGAGLSRQKIAAVRSLAEHFANGDLGQAVFDEFDDEAIIERLTQVRGVGRWTAEMFMMFFLRRPDVLPVNDVGINRAMKNLYGLDALPAPDDVRRIGASWRPWATVACWYLWRSEDVRTIEAPK